ncbi:MAG: alpha/beta fold hydrolase [Bacillota bacterium]
MYNKRFISGHHEIHPDSAVNFQLNRWISYLGEDALQEIREIAPRLTDFNNFTKEFIILGNKALLEGRTLHAAYYYRSAEFFMFSDNKDKQKYRNRFLELVRQYFKLSDKDYSMIPYKDDSITTTLPALRLRHDNPIDTLVIFGGSDSYIEEFIPILIDLRDRGFDIICFEGPGQGCVLEDHRVYLTHEWHKPVKSVLDYFGLDDVTLIGISMGGCMVIRAAAFEKRVKRVVAFDILYDSNVWIKKFSPSMQLMFRCLFRFKAKGIINSIMKKAMKRNMLFEWAIKHAMHIVGVDTPYDYFARLDRYTTKEVSELITQDVLLMAGKEDYAVPVLQFYQQIEALKNVRSLTARLFTKEENAQSHCQIGNLPLALDTITNWIEQTKRSYI